MLNHIHLIVSSNDKNLSDILRDFKPFTSNEITDLLQKEKKMWQLSIFEEAALADGKDNDFKVWQDGFYPKAIYDEKFAR